MKSIMVSGGLFLGLAACGLLGGCGPHAGAPKGFGPKGPPEVYVSAPISRDILDFEEFPGRLESDQTVQVRARVTGYLLRFNFKEGGTVKKDDVLFEIDPQMYEADLALAEGSVLEAQGQFEQAKADYERNRRLRVPDEINPSELSKYRGGYVMAEGKLKAAKASLKKAQINMSYTKVVAPIGGKISKSAIDPGNLVRADDTVLTAIGASVPIKASFDIDERTLARVVRLMEEGVIPRDPTGIPVDMWMADQTDHDPPQKGKIDFADTYVDTATGTLRVRGVFDNEKELLVPGMFVRVRLYIGTPQPSVLIAEKAMVTDQGQKFVYVLKNEDSTKQEAEVEYRPVEIGRLQEGRRVIKNGGLKASEKVVISGLQRVRPGIKVKYKEKEMPAVVAGAGRSDSTKVQPSDAAPATTPKHNKGARKKGR